MKLHTIALVTLFIGMMFVGITTYMDDLGTSYSQTADYTGLNKTSTRLTEQRDTLNDSYSELTSIEPELGLESLTVPYKLLKAAWTAVTAIFGSFNVVIAIFSDIGNVLGDSGIAIPGWFTQTIVVVIFVLVMAMIIYAFFKWKFED